MFRFRNSALNFCYLHWKFIDASYNFTNNDINFSLINRTRQRDWIVSKIILLYNLRVTLVQSSPSGRTKALSSWTASALSLGPYTRTCLIHIFGSWKRSKDRMSVSILFISSAITIKTILWKICLSQHNIKSMKVIQLLVKHWFGYNWVWKSHRLWLLSENRAKKRVNLKKKKEKGKGKTSITR